MSAPYFITGLPRSRLSWLANLLTWKSNFCYHGALSQCACISDLERILYSSPDGATRVGDSDPLIGCVAKEVIRAFPESKFVFVFRPMSDCMAEELSAVSNLGLPAKDLSDYLQITSDGLDELWLRVDRDKRMWVSFADLDRQAVVENVWKFCLPGEEFPLERYRMLDCLRVTQLCSKTLARFPHQPFRQMLPAKEKA